MVVTKEKLEEKVEGPKVLLVEDSLVRSPLSYSMSLGMLNDLPNDKYVQDVLRSIDQRIRFPGELGEKSILETRRDIKESMGPLKKNLTDPEMKWLNELVFRRHKGHSQEIESIMWNYADAIYQEIIYPNAGQIQYNSIRKMESKIEKGLRGVRVDLAIDVASALDRLKNDSYDAVITDLGLPLRDYIYPKNDEGEFDDSDAEKIDTLFGNLKDLYAQMPMVGRDEYNSLAYSLNSDANYPDSPNRAAGALIAKIARDKGIKNVNIFTNVGHCNDSVLESFAFGTTPLSIVKEVKSSYSALYDELNYNEKFSRHDAEGFPSVYLGDKEWSGKIGVFQKVVQDVVYGKGGLRGRVD